MPKQDEPLEDIVGNPMPIFSFSKDVLKRPQHGCGSPIFSSSCSFWLPEELESACTETSTYKGSAVPCSSDSLDPYNQVTSSFRLFGRSGSPIIVPPTPIIGGVELPTDKLIYSTSILIRRDRSRYLSGEEIKYIKSLQDSMQRDLGESFYNSAVRAAVSCLQELYKNSKDSKAKQLTLSVYKDTQKHTVHICDNGDGFSARFLRFFPENEDGINMYPNLRLPREEGHTIPYKSDKYDAEIKKTTGGAGLGLYYLALTTQNDPQGTVLLENGTEPFAGANIILIASEQERASYGFQDIINYRSNHGYEPQTPCDLRNYCPQAGSTRSPARVH